MSEHNAENDRYGFLSSDGYPEEGPNPLIKPLPSAEKDAPPEPVECCASGRCEVCTPGYEWGGGYVTPPDRTVCFICGEPRKPGSEWCAEHTEGA